MANAVNRSGETKYQNDKQSVERNKEVFVPRGLDLGDKDDKEFLRDLMNRASQSSGDGSWDYQFQVFCQQLDRFQHAVLPPNNEHSGLTFMTRPKLNLQDATLRTSRMLTPLMTTQPESIGFAIRCLLDTKLSGMAEYKKAATECPFFNHHNPLLVPVCNALTNISGFPDPYLQTFTSNPGFFSEDQTIVIGGDNMNKTYDLSLSFSDPQYGMLVRLFVAWYEYMRLVSRGLATAYKEDIDLQRINYTVSIYRFVMDPKRKYVTRYGRAVGCFPKSVPYGSMMNVNEGETFVNSIGQYTIPFTANKVMYDDFAILEDFNTLMKSNLPSDLVGENRAHLNPHNVLRLPYHPMFNYAGYPYIFHTSKGIKIDYITSIQKNVIEHLWYIGITDLKNYSGLFLSKNGQKDAIDLMDTIKREKTPGKKTTEKKTPEKDPELEKMAREVEQMSLVD